MGARQEKMVEANENSPLVGALLDPRAYPHGTPAVEMVETHISFIFLAGDFAYKVKKPVNYGFLDFTTLEKRRHFCQREVELNRRICPEVYLGVEEIRQKAGGYTVGGPGRTVEYAVKMRRLSPESSLELLLKQGRISAQDIERIAARIARFHHRTGTGPRITSYGDLEAVRQNVKENFLQTEGSVGSALSRETYDDLVAYSQAFMSVRKDVFRSRAQEGRVRDCHGDLHVAQIFLESPSEDGSWDGISIIDCIEFNERFRCSDVTENIAFLAMDLDFNGRPDLSCDFVEAYARESGDNGIFDLLDFFKVYRAYVRGKVACFRTGQSHLQKDTRLEALETARAYFELAHSYLPMFPKPAVILTCGVTGTGKSTLAAELASRWSMAHVSSDLVRKNLAGIDPRDHRYESFGEGIYSPQFSALTYETMLSEAKQHLQEGETVILDGTFRRSEERARALALAEGLPGETWIVECRLREEQARERLQNRMARGDSVSDGRWELYHQQMAQWEPVRGVSSERHIILDTGGSLEETVRNLLQWSYERVLQHSLRPGPPSA